MSQKDKGYSLIDWAWIVFGAGVIVTGLWLWSTVWVTREPVIIIDARDADAPN